MKTGAHPMQTKLRLILYRIRLALQFILIAEAAVEYRNFLLIRHNVLLHVRVSRQNRCAYIYSTIVLCRCH